MTVPLLSPRQRQHQTLSPRLQHAVRLLHMSSAEFVQALSDTLQRNPFLETDNPDENLIDPGSDAPASEPGERADIDHADIARWEETAAGQAGGSTGSRLREDGDTGWMDTMAVESSLASHLHAQLDVLNLPLRDRLLAKAIVESLDDDGYLRLPFDELLHASDLQPPADVDEWLIALRHVQSLEPAGVAARSVQEALLLQLPAIACPQDRELAQAILSEHMDRLAARDVAGLSKRLRRDAVDIERACARIRHLDPRPGWRFGSAPAQYVTPDVIVKKQRDTWVTALNPAIVPRLRMNRVIEELYRRQDRHQHVEMSAHLQEARWTLRNVEQRFATILGVAEAIVERQRQFLEFGPMAMKPLGLREIAERVGVHESTVSRVTHNKYMATPNGTFELKYFFSRSMTTAAGGECSGTALRGLIKTMIEAEKPAQPLSDAELARMLSRQGLPVARRTVTKYRQALRYEPAERRRRSA